MKNQLVYFSNIRAIIIENLKAANQEVLIAVAWFTDTEIINTLLDVSDRGVKISIIIYDDKINNKDLFQNLYYKKADIRVSEKMMHNKFCIIDNSTVINGSYNWTNKANYNSENIQVSLNDSHLSRLFVDQFYSLQKFCKKIDDHFKYALNNINQLEQDFARFYETLKAKKFPYFYKLENFVPHEMHFNPKIKNGFFLINNDIDELNFYRLKFYLEKGFNLTQVQKITMNSFSCPKYFENIVELKNVNSKIIPVQNKSYVVEESIRRFSGNGGNVYSIDFNGNIIIKKIQYLDKINNKYYIVSYLYGSTKVLDQRLNEIKFNGRFCALIPNVGIISYLGVYKHGLTDLNGNLLIQFLFDEYKLIDDSTVEFYEYPHAYSKYSEYYDQIIVENYVKTKNPCYKVHKLDIKTMNFYSLGEIHNNEKETEYFFDSDDNYNFKEFYLKCSGVAITLKRFKEIKRDFERYTYKSVLQKTLYAEQLSKTHSYKLSPLSKTIHSNNNECYVATLVYKDNNHPKVDYLRNYRDNNLNNYVLGRYFIVLYYKFSPEFVKFIKPYKKLHRLIEFLLNVFIYVRKSYF